MIKDQDIIHITHTQGGISEFKKTGVYPNYLIFYSDKQKKKWKHKFNGIKKEGKLISGGKLLYYYSIDESDWKVFDCNGNEVQTSYTNILND